MATQRKQKKPANPKQAEELFREGQRILAERPAAQPTSPATPATPPKPEKPVDLLRDSLKDDSHNDALFRLIIKGIGGMRYYSLQRVAQCVDMVRRYRGCSTPAENLIQDLLRQHYEWGGITPEELAYQLDENNSDGFRCNFDDAMEIANNIQITYPKLMAGGAE
jgi:hypothetical protein